MKLGAEAMTKNEALKLALEYVELVQDDRYNAEHIDREALVTAIKEALAQRTWVGLTDEDELDWDGGDLKSLVKAIEAKLKEKNT